MQIKGYVNKTQYFQLMHIGVTRIFWDLVDWMAGSLRAPKAQAIQGESMDPCNVDNEDKNGEMWEWYWWL